MFCSTGFRSRYPDKGKAVVDDDTPLRVRQEVVSLGYLRIVVRDEDDAVCATASRALGHQRQPTYGRGALVEKVVAVHGIYRRNPCSGEGIEKPGSSAVDVHQVRSELLYDLTQLNRNASIKMTAEEVSSKALDAERARFIKEI